MADPTLEPPPEYGVDDLTGQEMIGGTLMLPGGRRFRIKTKLITLIGFSKKLRDETSDIANAVATFFQQNAAMFKGAPGASATNQQVAAAVASYLQANPPAPGQNASDQQVSSAVATYMAANPPAAGKSIEIQKTATAIQARQTGGTWSDLVLLSALKGDQGPPGSTFVGTATVTETALILISSGQRKVTNITVTPAQGQAVAAGDLLMIIPTTEPATGYAIDNVFATGANKITATVQTPGLAIGASYSIPVRLYRLPA